MASISGKSPVVGSSAAALSLLTLCLLAFAGEAVAQLPTPTKIYYVSTAGSAGNPGTQAAPWDLATGLNNSVVKPGEHVYIAGGTYTTSGYGGDPGMRMPLNLVGDANRPIVVRAAPGQRVTFSGGLQVLQRSTSAYVWLYEIEIANQDWTEGLSLYAGEQVKIINCIIHDNPQAIGDWTQNENQNGSHRSEIYGCSFYDNGTDPAYSGDRYHGHCIYSQNIANWGQKTYSNNVMRSHGTYADGQFTIHCYGGGAAAVYGYMVDHNIAYNSYGWLIGGSNHSEDLHMISNYIYNVPNVWFGNPWSSSNSNGEFLNNLCVYPYWGVSLYFWTNLVNSGNLTVNQVGVTDPPPASQLLWYYDNLTPPVAHAQQVAPQARPTGLRVALLPNKYDPSRANLAIFNWNRAANVSVSLAGFASAGQNYSFFDHTHLYGAAVMTGTYDGTGVNVAMNDAEFAVYVVKKIGNLAPTVNAGADQTFHLPLTSTNLAGTVSDDGLPVGATVTRTWSKVSGPGTVTFAYPSLPATTATFSTLGTYVLRFTADDTALTSSDDVQIVYAPEIVNAPPTANAGPDQTVALSAQTVLTLSGSVSDDGVPSTAAFFSQWTVISGMPATVRFADAWSAVTTATFDSVGTFTLRLTANDTQYSASDECQVVVLPPGQLHMLLHLAFDETTGTVAADSSGNGRNGALHGGATHVAGKQAGAVQFNMIDGYVQVPNFALPGNFTLAFWFQQNNPTGTGAEALFSWGACYAGNDLNVWLWDALSPSPTNMMYSDLEDSSFAGQWGEIDKLDYPTDAAGRDIPGGDPNLTNGQWHHYAMTAAAGVGTKIYIDGVPKAGSTVIGGAPLNATTDIFIGARSNLAASRFDGGAIDDVRIYDSALSDAQVAALVAPPQTPPTVDAGVDAKVMMPNALALAGTVSDDGQPAPCTAAWSKLTGPGTVTFANPAAASSMATFSAAGTYTLRLTASDTSASVTDDVQVIVFGPGDFTGDGKVDGLDFLAWQSHYPNFTGGATPGGGDANGDGKVDGLDFLVWQATYHP